VHQDFLAGVGALAGYQFTFDICIRHQQLSAVTEMVRRCPEVFFVLDHGAKPAIRDGSLDPWRQHLRELSHLPNVACKISGLVTEAKAGHAGPEVLRPYVTHILECFEFGRVMFGGDWPVCLLASPYADWQAALQTILAGVSEADLVKLYQTNAELVYRI
jgi:L-fuconolactonase